MKLIDADVVIRYLTNMKNDWSSVTDSLFGKGIIKGLDIAIKKMQAEPVIEAEPASEQNIWEREKPTNKIMEYDEVYGHCPNCGCVVTDLNDIYVGLEPEEIRELATAKKEGRLVVLPCKAGDTVWFIKSWFSMAGAPMEANNVTIRGIDGNGEVSYRATLVSAKIDRRFMSTDIGKTVFLTREEAEAAIKGDAE